jgi:hypothetical protein
LLLYDLKALSGRPPYAARIGTASKIDIGGPAADRCSRLGPGGGCCGVAGGAGRRLRLTACHRPGGGHARHGCSGLGCGRCVRWQPSPRLAAAGARSMPSNSPLRPSCSARRRRSRRLGWDGRMEQVQPATEEITATGGSAHHKVLTGGQHLYACHWCASRAAASLSVMGFGAGRYGAEARLERRIRAVAVPQRLAGCCGR